MKTNKNYYEVAKKYKLVQKQEEKVLLYDYEDVIKDLNEQFTKLSITSQNELIYYFSFRSIFDLITNIPNYESLTVNAILDNLQSNKDWEEIKKKVYDDVKMALEVSKNDIYKKSVFANINFTTIENYITSIVKILNNLNNKKELALKIPTEVYFVTENYEQLENLSVVNTTLDIGYINGQVAGNSSKKAILANLNKGVFVLYSDRIVLFSKDKELEFTTQLRENKTLTFSIKNTILQRVNETVIVTKYSSNIVKGENIDVVSALNIKAKNEYYKVIFNNKG